jgi:hypothetical protein
MVVLPAASRPTIRILISFLPNYIVKRVPKTKVGSTHEFFIDLNLSWEMTVERLRRISTETAVEPKVTPKNAPTERSPWPIRFGPFRATTAKPKLFSSYQAFKESRKCHTHLGKLFVCRSYRILAVLLIVDFCQ